MPDIKVVDDAPQFHIAVDAEGKVLYSAETIAREAALRAEVARLRAAAKAFIEVASCEYDTEEDCEYCATNRIFPHKADCAYFVAENEILAALKQEPENV